MGASPMGSNVPPLIRDIISATIALIHSLESSPRRAVDTVSRATLVASGAKTHFERILSILVKKLIKLIKNRLAPLDSFN
jgi:hypothetical protein